MAFRQILYKTQLTKVPLVVNLNNVCVKISDNCPIITLTSNGSSNVLFFKDNYDMYDELKYIINYRVQRKVDAARECESLKYKKLFKHTIT